MYACFFLKDLTHFFQSCLDLCLGIQQRDLCSIQAVIIIKSIYRHIDGYFFFYCILIIRITGKTKSASGQ